MQNKLLLILILISISCSFSNATNRILMNWETTNPAFDNTLYESVLDPMECKRQLSHIQRDTNLRFQYAGPRMPKGINQGNTLDMGNYHGCLRIHQVAGDSTIQGKYCMINVPADKITFPKILKLLGVSDFSEGIFENGTLSEEVIEVNRLIKNKALTENVKLFRESDQVIDDNDSTNPINFRMAVCIPKSCTISEGLSELFYSAKAVDLQYEEEFCRLPNDKPWAPADYVAIVLFSVIGVLTIVSTFYDLHNRFIVHRDLKSVNPLYNSFSLYTNARRLTNFSKNPNTLESLDGIRALSLVWIITLHTFNILPPVINITDCQDWQLSLRSIWITSAPLAVDTFLMMSGMLLVYTKAGKSIGSKLFSNLHLFYLNRILRMFPLLAAGILMQASFFHWISDGPLWQDMAFATNICRNYWWLNLLYVNNFFVPICLGVSWYLAVDMQLHILSPILLYFVLSSSKRQAWLALTAGLLATLTATTIWVFIKQLPGASFQPARIDEKDDFMNQYYLNTLPRAAPFLVGMIFGYILHLYRKHKPKFSKRTVFLIWCLIIIMSALSLYSPEPMKDVNHDNQTVDSLVNAFARTAWAFAVASLAVVCVNGYGGPVNWFLSLQIWKLISRISYAMYLFHYPLILLIIGSYLQPIYFSVFGALYSFFSIFSISFIVGFIVTLVIDLPFSTLFNQLLGGGGKRADGSPDGKRLPPPIDIRNTRGVTSALPTFEMGCSIIGLRNSQKEISNNNIVRQAEN